MGGAGGWGGGGRCANGCEVGQGCKGKGAARGARGGRAGCGGGSEGGRARARGTRGHGVVFTLKFRVPVTDRAGGQALGHHGMGGLCQQWGQRRRHRGR